MPLTLTWIGCRLPSVISHCQRISEARREGVMRYLVLVMVVTLACSSEDAQQQAPDIVSVGRQGTKGLPEATPTLEPLDLPRSVSGARGCSEWTELIHDLSSGGRSEAEVRPHYVKLMLLENVRRLEQLYESHFRSAIEPELRERGELVMRAAQSALEETVDVSAIYLTDACYHYGYESSY